MFQGSSAEGTAAGLTSLSFINMLSVVDAGMGIVIQHTAAAEQQQQPHRELPKRRLVARATGGWPNKAWLMI